MLISGLGQLLL